MWHISAIVCAGLLWLNVPGGSAVTFREQGVSGGGGQYVPTTELDPVRYIHRYSFVLVRYGMTVPVHPSHEDDPDYRMEWAALRGSPTLEGTSLIEVVGASLRSHYRHFLDPPAYQRSHQRMAQAWTMDDVLVSASEDSARAKEFSGDLRRGLFGSSNAALHARTVYEPYYDKGAKVKSCHYWESVKRVFNDPRYELSLVNDFRRSCNNRLYTIVQNHVDTYPHSEWFINHPERLHRLFEMIVFEAAQQGAWPRRWMSQISSIEACVTDYFLSFINDKDIRELLLGQILQEIKTEYTLNSMKLHLHLTDDLTFLGLAWLTRDLWRAGGDHSRVEWPNFGDALIFDFSDSAVQVTMFSPMSPGPAPGFWSPMIAPDRLFQMVDRLSAWMWQDKSVRGVQLVPGTQHWYSQTSGGVEGTSYGRTSSRILRMDSRSSQSSGWVRSKRSVNNKFTSDYMTDEEINSNFPKTNVISPGESTIYAWKGDDLPTSLSLDLVYVSDYDLQYIHLCDLEALSKSQQLGGGGAGGSGGDGKLVLIWDGQVHECYIIFLSQEELRNWRLIHPKEHLIPHIISHTPIRSS